MLSSSILRKLRFSSDSCEQTQDQGIVRSVSFRASKVFEGGRKTSVKILDRSRKGSVKVKELIEKSTGVGSRTTSDGDEDERRDSGKGFRRARYIV